MAVSKSELVSLNHLDVVRDNWSKPVFCTPAVWNLLSDAIADHGYDLRCLLAEVMLQISEEAAKQPLLNVVFFKLHICGGELALKVMSSPYGEPTCTLTIMLAGERV